MGVRGRDGGPLLVSEEEMEAASMRLYQYFCGRLLIGFRLLSCILLLQDLRVLKHCIAAFGDKG